MIAKVVMMPPHPICRDGYRRNVLPDSDYSNDDDLLYGDENQDEGEDFLNPDYFHRPLRDLDHPVSHRSYLGR